MRDAVSSQDSHLLRRTSRYGLNDKQSIFGHIELDTDAIEVSLQGLVHFLYLFRIGVSGMRIEFFQHADDGTLDQLVRIGFIDIQIGYGKLSQCQLANRRIVLLVLLRLNRTDRKKAGKQACYDR